MKKTNKFLSIILLIFAVSLMYSISGCGDGGDNGGDYDAPEFEWEGTGEDGDNDTSTDGDMDNSTDGDEDGDTTTDGDTTDPDQVGSIAGKVTASSEMAAFDSQVQIFNKNPMVEWGTQAYKTFSLTGDANTTEKTYSFEDLPAGVYYVWVYVNVGNNQDTTDDVFAVYPQYVKIDPKLDNYRDRENVDMYVDSPNTAQGSISGTLHLSSAYQSKRIMVVTSEYETTNPEYWPNSVTFTEPAASETRAYNNTNLTNGTYYTMLYVYPDDDAEVPLVYRSPYDALKIDIEDSSKKDYTDQHFYLGIADPNFGSISGTMTLPTAISGDIGVYLFASKQTEEVKTKASENSQYILLLENDGTSTSFPYTVGNIKSQDEIWVGGYINLDADHIGMGYYMPDDPENPLSIDLDGTKDLTGINFEVAITEMHGTLTITHDETPVMVKMVLADMDIGFNLQELKIETTIDGYGGFTTVEIGDTSGSPITTNYTMFPTYGGQFAIIAVIYTEKSTTKTEDGDADDEAETPDMTYNETWCYRIVQGSVNAITQIPTLNKVSVDGTQTDYEYNIILDTTADGTVPLSTVTYGTWMCAHPE